MKYKINKKAISPLIATVLVIGFTIVLAGVVMQFLIPLFTQSTEKPKADAQLMNVCGQFSTNLAVTDAKYEAEELKFTIDNSGNGKVREFIVKLYTKAGNAGSCTLNITNADFLGAAGVKRVTLKQTGATAPALDCESMNIITAEDTLDKIEVTPAVYNEVTKLTTPCTGVVLTGTVY